MSVDDVIELDTDDFARFVMDQWSWKQGSAETTAYYEHAARPARRSGARGCVCPSEGVGSTLR